MAAAVVAFVFACIVLWLGVGLWLGRRVGLDVLALFGLVAIPAFVLYFALRSDVTTLGVVVAAAAWLACGILLVSLRRRPARRAGGDGDTSTPS